MVKADFKKDYYADLELPSTADHDEVKKQFRLLGT
jgi:curved DNA-binding protein CbpA